MAAIWELKLGEAAFNVVLEWAAASLRAVGADAWAVALENVAKATGAAIARELNELLAGFVIDYVQQRWGVVLSPSDPFSRGSISGGIGQKIGIPLRDVFDKEILLQDVGAGLAAMINARYGTTFTTFWPLETLQFEVEAQVFALLSDAVDELHAETKAGLAGAENG